ncbi:Aspartic proteinase 36-like protein [Drosera capensis]
MPTSIFAGIVIWAVVTGAVAVVGGAGFQRSLALHRSFPNDERVDFGQLRARDRIRHGRLLQSIDGIVGFPLAGSYDPYTVGLYYTQVSMGTPAQVFHVQIDTGSDVLWIQLNAFDPSSSSTATIVSCSSSLCSLGTDSSDSACNSETEQCSYQFTYGDGSGTGGYYVYDVLHLETVVGSTWTTNNSAKVVFGCSEQVIGDLTKTDRAVDGIFGFGQQAMSVVSQLASQGATPQVFSHCLRGDSAGGGILVLGEIVEPGIVYTPLVQSQPHYNLNLESISIDGETVSIPSSAFTTSSTSGTIVDSGTTLAYLAESAYDPFVSAISNAVAQSVRPLLSQGTQCYLITASVDQIFPNVSLNFAGGASMILKPEDYLLQANSINGAEVWCIGFQQTQSQELTILGDLVLQDKIIVYDLEHQRVGWVNYDCASSVNVSTNTSTGSNTNTYINTGQLSSSSSKNTPYITILSTILIPLLIRIY